MTSVSEISYEIRRYVPSHSNYTTRKFSRYACVRTTIRTYFTAD